MPSLRRRPARVLSDDDEAEEHQSSARPSSQSEESDYESKKPKKGHPKTTGTGRLKPINKTNKALRPSSSVSAANGSPKPSPAKSKTGATQTKSGAADRPKPTSKPIYSFFNTATQQLQRPPNVSASPDKRVVSAPQHESDAIHDDSDETNGAELHATTASSTALAVRKRKVQHEGSFENESGLLPPAASQKFRKTSNGDRVPSFSGINDDKRPWTDQFPPLDLSELAVHKRKVADVRQWMEMAVGGHRHRVLVLKGGAGTGKTTTVRLLAKELDFHISEWKNPEGGEFASEGAVAAALHFDDFISRAGRSGGLQFARDEEEVQGTSSRKQSVGTVSTDSDRQLLLIEEFPNTSSRASATLQSFRSAIAQYLSMPVPHEKTPTLIIMIISETLLSTSTSLADSFTSHRLLGPELSNHPFFDTIEFNAVAPTILIKALETVVLKEARKTGRRRTPGPQILKRLAEDGDIRSAVSSLEFLCLRGDGDDIWSSKVTFTKQKKTKTDPPLTQAEEEALKLISNRETTLEIFHAVGKVVYNKRTPSPSIVHPPPWLPQHRRANAPENDVDALVNDVGTDTATFLAALHENYALSCSSSNTEESLDSVLGCLESVSDADLLSLDRFSSGGRASSGSATDGMRQDEMAFHIGVRGLWFYLPSPVHRILPPGGKPGDAHRMFYPVSMRLWRKREEMESKIDSLMTKLQAGDLITSALVPGSKSGSGVEAWKHLNRADSRSGDVDSTELSATRSNGAKLEVSLERLPYLAQIATASKMSPSTLEQLKAVTRIQTSSPIVDTDDPNADEDDEVQRLPTNASRQDKAAASTTKGLGLLAESSLERLVLEDDDIVDD